MSNQLAIIDACGGDSRLYVCCEYLMSLNIYAFRISCSSCEHFVSLMNLVRVAFVSNRLNPTLHEASSYPRPCPVRVPLAVRYRSSSTRKEA